ncbi:MAG: 3-oxoacyl-[acyl-carrier-protein] synthase III C-terminal domain-containing protein [Bacilli bacterium]
MFVFHQASELIIRSFAKLLKIPSEKMHFKLHDVGNTGGSTVGITLADAIMNGKVNLRQSIAVGIWSWTVGARAFWVESRLYRASSDADFKDSPPKPQSQICGGK